MKRLISLFVLMVLVTACESAMLVKSADQVTGDSDSVHERIDSTNLITIFLRENSTFVKDCHQVRSSPDLWLESQVYVDSSFVLRYRLYYYNTSDCSGGTVVSRTLRYNIDKITTSSTLNEYILSLELFDEFSSYNDPGTFPEEDFYDYGPRLTDMFYWQIKLDPEVPQSDVSFPNESELEDGASLEIPLKTTDMFNVVLPS